MRKSTTLKMIADPIPDHNSVSPTALA